MYSTAYTKSIVQILYCNVCILGCGTAFPPLPNHGIYIYNVEYTYPQTGKIFWLAKGGNVLKLNLSSFLYIKQTVKTENETYFISLRENERQFTKYKFIAIGNAKNL